MQITVDPQEDFTLLHLRGEFDTFYCPMLQKEIDGLISAGVTRIAINLRLVKFINSTALGAIIKAARILGANDGKLVISRPSPFCREIIEKVGLDRVVPIYDTDEDAGRALVEDHTAPAREDEPSVLEDESAVLFSLRDVQRIEHFIPEDQRAGPANPVHGHAFGATWRGVGRMSALDAEGLSYVLALHVRKNPRDPSKLDIAVTKDDTGATGRRVVRGIPVIVDAGADGIADHEVGASGGRHDLRLP